MSLPKKFYRVVGANYLTLFLFGAFCGGGFELFKIKFYFLGFNYYKSFTRLQVPRELEAYERNLKELDYVLEKKYEPHLHQEDNSKKE
uniref:COX6C domain-containing protein n=1 Tax=Strongyloides stercoralis TaxID=6248 RepID=A0A0K0E3J5_STRER